MSEQEKPEPPALDPDIEPDDPSAPFGRVTEEQLKEIGRACFGIKYEGDQ